MSEASAEEIIVIVESIFRVSQIDKSPDTLQFRIEDDDFKTKFIDLARNLESKDLMCRLERVDGSTFILVRRIVTGKQRKWLSGSLMQRLLFGIVVGFVMIDGYYRTIDINNLINIGEPIEIAIIYTISLVGILGVHEAGHLVAAKYHKIKTTWPFFIPGIPVYGIPTFGAVIRSRGLTINREILFDVAIAGPIAGLVIAIIVSMYGAYTAPVITQEVVNAVSGNFDLTAWQQGEPLFMTASLAAFGKGGPGQEVLMTPVLFAAWLGFLITFLNMLPAWQLDGGHMARSIFGARWHQIATYASMGILALLGFWFMALLILVLSSRNPGAQPLDDISPLSNKRKYVYIAIIVLTIFCAPLPDYILS
jgi:membrane-associated protease RseP (regulator of RpoE activity)